MSDCVNISSSDEERDRYEQEETPSSEQPTNTDNNVEAPSQEQPSQRKTRSRRTGTSNLFDENSKFLADFDPGSSQRERRKLARSLRQSIHELKYTPIHNEKGAIRNGGKDLCDCLDDTCPGCHFPCQYCGSGRCGPICRKNRKWTYEQVECESNGLKIRNPCLVEQTKK